MIGIINLIIAFFIKGLQIFFIIMIYKLLKAKLVAIKSFKHKSNLDLNPYESVYEDFYEEEAYSIYYPMFDYIKIEINSIICVFLWNHPFA